MKFIAKFNFSLTPKINLVKLENSKLSAIFTLFVYHINYTHTKKKKKKNFWKKNLEWHLQDFPLRPSLTFIIECNFAISRTFIFKLRFVHFVID